MNKESYFSTAQIVKAQDDGLIWDMPVGTFVSVKYQFHAMNHVTNQDEAVYLVRASLDEPWRGHVFSNALDHFVI